MDVTIRLPGGTEIPGSQPVVIIGPNGSGKTRQARQLEAADGVTVSIVNALRNTRVTREVPAMGLTNARSNLAQQAQQAKTQYWEQVSDFDMLLARLHAEDAAAAFAFRDAVRSNAAIPDGPPSAMERVQGIWERVFPGRSLGWDDNVPMVRSSVPGSEPSYQGHFMSDGEKAALYIAGKVFVAEPGVLIVDEPETHFHSLIAVDLWDQLEAARDDLRLVYVTHDLTFALSRRDATFLLASPAAPMRVLDSLELPRDAVETLLGAASFSFYARRLILCEGEAGSVDDAFYRSWFDARDTVVRPLGSCNDVIRAAGVLQNSNLTVGLEVVGIIDRDYQPQTLLDSLPDRVMPLTLHEVESLYCLPAVVAAVARHLGRDFDETAYAAELCRSVTDAERHKVIIERWKRRLDGPLHEVVNRVVSRTVDIESVIADVPRVFDQANWDFSPAELLAQEKDRVERAVGQGAADGLLILMPGKPLLAIAARAVGLRGDHYVSLVNQALAGTDGLAQLGADVEASLSGFLPRRRAATSTTEVNEAR